ncbi:MAG: hypothetical protein ACK4TF_04400 [Thermodesulfovibrionales bacterium]
MGFRKGASSLISILTLILISALLYAQEKRYSLSVEGSPSYGPSDAPVTIIEFLDYQ